LDLYKYKLQDFLEDKSFHNWVFCKNPEDVAFWNKWVQNHPDKKERVMEAAQIVKGFETTEKQFSYNEVHSFWQEVEARLQTKATQDTPSIASVHPQTSRRVFFRMAAAITGFLLLSVGAWWYVQQSNTVEYATNYGETSTIALPDGSQVTLNGNSKLHYLAGWEIQAEREVWLEGEAFFEVEKIANTNQNTGFVKFTVHTSNLDIEVIGTAFNVNDRHNETTVVLEEGKVKLQSEWLDERHKELVMQPGEMVAASKAEKKLDKKVVNPTNYSAWRYNKLIFDNSSIADIAQMLEDNYGLIIEVEDPEMWQSRFTGSAPANRPDILYKAVAASFGWKEKKEGKVIHFNYP